MGMMYVNAVIRNPADPTRKWEGRFLVDTGAIDTLVPRACIEAIGLEPETQRTYELADGTQARMDIGGARIEFMGERTYSDVIFGSDNTEPLLGVTALESVGIEVDPRNQRLKKLPSVRLKKSWLEAVPCRGSLPHPGNGERHGVCAVPSRPG